MPSDADDGAIHTNAAGLGTTKIRMVMQREEKQGRAWQERFQWPEARSVKRQAPGAPAFPQRPASSQRPTRCASTSSLAQTTSSLIPVNLVGNRCFRVECLDCMPSSADRSADSTKGSTSRSRADWRSDTSSCLAGRRGMGAWYGARRLRLVAQSSILFQTLLDVACPFWRP